MLSQIRAVNRTVVLAVGALAAAAVLVGCGKSTTQTVSETPTVAETAIPTAPPSGTPPRHDIASAAAGAYAR